MRLFVTYMLMVLMSIFASGKAFALVLSDQGASAYVIVLDEAASAPQKSAAHELQKYLKLVTDVEFPIQATRQAGQRGILIGASKEVRQIAPDVAWNTLPADAIVIRTLGQDLILAGGEPRGTLYAVNTFLEDVVGVRWWTSTEQFVPKKPRLDIGELNIHYAPQIAYREAHFDDIYGRNPAFAVRLKLNGHFTSIPPEYGGHYSILGFCHTFEMLIPQKKYYAQHPEWFSLVKGKRMGQDAQLCLTNDEMRHELTKNALEWVRAHPDAGYISITQNDNQKRCECENCKAVEKQEQSAAGPLIRFVNAVAADIAKENPSFKVETLAYQYTRKPPAVTKPAANVIVRLCSIECMSNRPLTDPVNRKFVEDINGWRRITPNLFIWDYVTNFTNYMLPHPNLDVLGPNVKFFAKYKVNGVFEQGNSECTAGDFGRLRLWLLAHMLWNPDADENKLIDEFMTGYYGAAAPALKEYEQLLQSAAHDRLGIDCFNQDHSYLKLTDMNRASELFDQALKAVVNEPELTLRVRREKLSLDYLWIQRYAWLKREGAAWQVPFGGPSEPKAAAENFIRDLKEAGGERLRFHEGDRRSVADIEEHIRRMAQKGSATDAAVPDVCANIPQEYWWDIQDRDALVIPNSFGVKKVDDPQASDGRAVFFPAGSADWLTQFVLPSDAFRVWRSAIRVYVVVKCDAKAAQGTALTLGIWDFGANKELMGKAVPVGQIADGAYHTIDLGEQRLGSNMRLWIVPGKPDVVGSISIDRVFLVGGAN